jgi:uncharacterized protein YjlB
MNGTQVRVHRGAIFQPRVPSRVSILGVGDGQRLDLEPGDRHDLAEYAVVIIHAGTGEPVVIRNFYVDGSYVPDRDWVEAGGEPLDLVPDREVLLMVPVSPRG